MKTMHGGLTVENLETFAQAILEKLKGKKYVFTSWNEGSGYESSVNVRPDQYLENGNNGTPLSIFFDEKNDIPHYAGFNFCDSYGVWGTSTSKHDSDLKFGWDSNFDAPYIVIDYSYIKIIHRAPAGHVLIWVISIQD